MSTVEIKEYSVSFYTQQTELNIHGKGILLRGWMNMERDDRRISMEDMITIFESDIKYYEERVNNL